MWPAASSARGESLPGALLPLFLLAALLVACSAHPVSTAPTIRIGLVAPFEGHGREIGYDVIYGARLAVRERNRAGGVAGYRVDLVALDDGGDPELAVDAAESLAIDPLVIGVLGHWTKSTTGAALAVYSQSGIPLLVPDAVLTEPGQLPADFVNRYEAVTPFDEEPGPRAATAYDGCAFLFDAIEVAVEQEGKPSRSAVAQALARLTTDGISGRLRTEPLDGLSQQLVTDP
jgi:ABC-type branched-subunit amino acid transport system substrate-binding protein